MSIYRFSAASPVREITFRYANDRPPVALIAAAPSADAEQISTIRRSLEAQKWPCVPVADRGREALQVDGFKDEGQLVALLMTQHFAKGNPQVQPEPGDHPTRTWNEWLEDTSMKACGWSYVVGDVALLISGLMSGRSKETLSGLLYTAGGLNLVRYGNIKNEYHIRDISEQMGEFFTSQAVHLPEECGLFTIMKQKREGLLPNIDRFLATYPSQVTTGLYATGAFAMLQSGLKHKKAWDTTYGAITTTAPFAAMVIPEKKKYAVEQEDEQPPAERGPIGGFMNWIQEKPLRLVGYAYVVGGLALGMSAYKEYKADPKQKSYIFKFITTATYLVGDVLLALSNKDHVNADGKFDTEEQRRIEALAAETIAAQPAHLRDPLIHHVAGFLSTQPEMRGTAADISVSITEQVQGMQRNRWVCRDKGTKWQGRVTEEAAPPPLRL